MTVTPYGTCNLPFGPMETAKAAEPNEPATLSENLNTPSTYRDFRAANAPETDFDVSNVAPSATAIPVIFANVADPSTEMTPRLAVIVPVIVDAPPPILQTESAFSAA